MKRLYKKKESTSKYQGLICPKIEKKLNDIRLEAAVFRPNFSGGPKVSIEGPGRSFIMDMQKGSCTCRKWDLTGLPCPHALVSIHENGDRVEDNVSVYYKVETFKNVYSHFINSTNHEDRWPDVMNGGEESRQESTGVECIQDGVVVQVTDVDVAYLVTIDS
uniref:SWIM-type domain-containing protein n=1 Tax=Solanum lycopersicum TaxID=4081 RepID=A0A3Q7EGY0_SOLLC